ncbi:glycine-rich domain-containing protein [Paraburkholderia aspalathi]|uniref:glycine-rich domain-containing protein n=1 Tax=Paraburkholderia aspalathi TaxID=1324617 RepID=UPI0038BC3DC6
MANRKDETWHRLREWTDGSAPSERLAAQILHHEGFEAIDPSHPLGGKDGGQDARCRYAGEPWSMAVYFPRGEKDYREIKVKFLSDAEKIKQQDAKGIAFVTNQELRLSERQELEDSVSPLKVELFHLERVVGILDRPDMESVRRQFLSIATDVAPTINNLGGTGGNAPGAGGGGGGAVGEARGGDGGSGGDIYNFSGTPGAAPGAGGGGAGAFGPGSQGAGGGGGGESVTAFFKITPGMKIPVVIGEPGKPDPNGGNGGDGGDTSFGDIVAKGGKGGKAGFSVIVSREVSEVDRDAGLHISTLMLAECCYPRSGLAYILAAGAEQITFAELPGRFSFVLFGVLSIGNATLGVEYEFTATFKSPNGDVAWSQPFKVYSGPPRQIARPFFALLIDCEIDQPGIWAVLIHSASHCFGRLPIEILASSS